MNAARVGENFGRTWHFKIRNYSTAGLSFGRYITLPIGMHRQRHREMECLNSYQFGVDAANNLMIIYKLTSFQCKHGKGKGVP